jgi:hypothetical protein
VSSDAQSRNRQDDLDLTPAAQKAAWLKQKIAAAIVDTRSNKRQNQRRATIIKLTTIVLSGAVTLLLGLQLPGLEPTFKNIAFAFGALVTLLNALEPFFNFRAMWIEHEVALAGFHRLADRLDFYLTGVKEEDLDLAVLDKFHQDYQTIWGNFSQAWIGFRRDGERIETSTPASTP